MRSDARKRNATVPRQLIRCCGIDGKHLDTCPGHTRFGEDCAAWVAHMDAQPEQLQPRLFVDTDGWDMHVWRHDPAHPSMPQPVLSAFDVKDPSLWAAIVALVDRGDVQ